MGYNKTVSNDLIARMSVLAEKVMNSDSGLVVETKTTSEAVRLRNQIYAARRALRSKNPNDKSALSVIEMRVEPTGLKLFKPGTIIQEFQIRDLKTGEQITIENTVPMQTFDLSEDSIFDMMMKLAEKHGPGDWEAEARKLLLSGVTPNNFS